MEPNHVHCDLSRAQLTEAGSKQKTIYKKRCLRDNCEKGTRVDSKLAFRLQAHSLMSRADSVRFCSEVCAYAHFRPLAETFTNKKILQQVTAAFTGYPKPTPVQIIQHQPQQTKMDSSAGPTAPATAPENDVVSVVRSQIAAITSRLELVRKRQEILRQAIEHAESLDPVITVVEEVRSGKSKRKGGPTEDKQCAWDPRLILSDEEVQAIDGADRDMGGVCELGKRRCDRHPGWQKTIALSLDVEEQQLVCHFLC